MKPKTGTITLFKEKCPLLAIFSWLDITARSHSFQKVHVVLGLGERCGPGGGGGFGGGVGRKQGRPQVRAGVGGHRELMGIEGRGRERQPLPPPCHSGYTLLAP